MRILGIDPDTRGSGWAILEGDPPKVILAGIVDTRGNTGLLAVEKQIAAIREEFPELPPVDYAICEYPQSYTRSRGVGGVGRPMNVDPNSLIMLAAVTGAALASANINEGGKLSIIRPAVWKGHRTKGATHRYVCRIVGWNYGLCSKATQPLTDVTPNDTCQIKPWKGRSTKPWSEILDAVGIALYELKKRHP